MMSEEKKKRKKIFVEGAISSQFIGESIAKHSTKTSIGAHQIFLGQIRADIIEGKKTKAIDFTTYQEMAEEEYYQLREELFLKYDLTCMHVYHSLGMVNAGEINLFIFVSSKHRRQSIDACAELVEMIKKRLPIWGKEIFDDENYNWKTNN